VPMQRIAFTLFLCAPAVLAQESLTNDDIVSLFKIGTTPSLLVHVINSSSGSYTLTKDEVYDLTRKGFQKEVLDAMEASASRNQNGRTVLSAAPCQPAVSSSSEPQLLGRRAGATCAWSTLPPEPVSWSGVAHRSSVMVMTAAMKGRRSVGTIKGKYAKTDLPGNPDFVFRGRPTDSASVVSLNSGTRARTLSDAAKHTEDCHQMENGDGRYRVHCDSLMPGEYGFYIQRSGPTPAKNSGPLTLYTFHVRE